MTEGRLFSSYDGSGKVLLLCNIRNWEIVNRNQLDKRKPIGARWISIIIIQAKVELVPLPTQNQIFLMHICFGVKEPAALTGFLCFVLKLLAILLPVMSPAQCISYGHLSSISADFCIELVFFTRNSIQIKLTLRILYAVRVRDPPKCEGNKQNNCVEESRFYPIWGF